ncbi:hypothetical protein [Dendronalium phyllosphericum]|nr:hypothetical protein [Dendronalium phyllosphericum]
MSDGTCRREAASRRVPAMTGSTNQRRDRFGFRHHQWNQWELNP